MRRGRVSIGRYAESAVHRPRQQLNPKVLPPDAHERTVRLLEHRPLVRRIAILPLLAFAACSDKPTSITLDVTYDSAWQLDQLDLGDRRVRQAMNHAINRKAIVAGEYRVDLVCQGGGNPPGLREPRD